MDLRTDAVVVICSRSQSSRLPGKCFKKIAGRTALAHLLNRLTTSRFGTILAVPDNETHLYTAYDARIYSGQNDSPLHRTVNAVVKSWPYKDVKWVVRVTHDDILVDVKTIEDLIAECDKQDAGYGCTPTIVEGAGVEVIRLDNLLAASIRRSEPTEFISYFVRGEGMPYPKIVRMRPRPEIERGYRLTLDYPADANVLETVLRATGPDAPLDAICAYIDRHPWVMHLNALPMISIYTCAYNMGPWIEKAMASVYALGLPEAWLEYIVVDDGSTDDTLTRIAKFGYRGIRLAINEANLGLASSSNRAVSMARAPVVMRLDGDDFLRHDSLPDLEVMSQMIRRDGNHVVYPGYEDVEPSGAVGDMHLPSEHHHVGGAMFDKRFLDELRFKEGLRNWDGLELHGRMVKAGAKIGYYDLPTWFYRKRADSMSRTNGAERDRLRKELEAQR